MDDGRARRVWERKGISLAMERGRVLAFVEDETKESARGKELPMIHYSYPDNSNK